MNAPYESCPEAEAMVRKIIQSVEDHKDLAEGNARIKCLLREGDWETRGHKIYAKVERPSSKWKHFCECDFLIVINQEAWDYMTPEKRRAVLDHELMHCAWAINAEGEHREDDEGRPVWTTVPHDLEEFGAIVERHGLWRNDLDAFFRKASHNDSLVEQLSLFSADPLSDDENQQLETRPTIAAVG